LAQDSETRILVSDNCSEDNTEEVVNSFADGRICYIRTPRLLSMEANFDFGLAHAEEGYVFIIGSDDAMMPDAVTTLRRVIKETGCLAVRPQLATYYWDNYPDETHQQIALDIPVGSSWRWMQSQVFLKAIAEDMLQHTLFFQLIPSLYHGCIHTSLLSETWPPKGPVIKSKMPDMYSGVLVAAKLPRYVILDAPISLNAMSCSSNGKMWTTRLSRS
jgi:glycosyltransferase involved in cell wall biosynthesis